MTGVAAIFEKVNPVDIVVEHWATLRDRRSEKANPWDFVVQYGIPLGVVVGFTVAQTNINNVTLGGLTTAISIIGGLLFNLLVLLHSLDWKETREPFASRLRLFLRELHSNISYAIVVALAAMIPLVVGMNYADQPSTARTIWVYTAAYLAAHFGIIMAMVLKRMHTALEYRLNPS